ncbi:hypothetical protein Ae201684P_019233 [Aphanomyces euteiches]|uniref:NADH:flavin oxidoreductase/NADH oxidase N-terminal domain-containing protein n=1 Tax=Aphanomyces euteiches TaxID=100861 RepID=A0A6G0XEG1_9STRA|nr:hypothetical protein Ae201684_005558 [Aphanomyces euteiches]KAH9078134.1 hypothetical protein Ae201684P_019233 [Aphanomyces euteiches]KAH9150854.1 hypothetical protein AeRB84_006393 [Aphanomyces euteiches]
MSVNLFTPVQIGHVQLKNRIFMAPLTRIRAGPSHLPNDLMKEHYAQRASAGLLITECTMISPNLSAFVGEPGVYSNDQLIAWKEITDAVHAKDGKIFIQLWHPGRRAHPDNNDGAPNVAPSAIALQGETPTLKGKQPHAVPRELTVGEILEIVEQFATAAKNSIDVAGFDGIEIHAANGYLIDQFLHSCANTRTDEYGGSLENRSRFLTQVLQAVTDAIGADKVGIRFSPINSHGWTVNEDPFELGEHLAKIAERFHVAYVHILRRDMFKVLQGDVEQTFRKHFHNTLISNMGYTKDEANAKIESGVIDAVAFGTLFIANPDLPERFAKDAELNQPNPATYYSCGAEGYNDYPTLS